MRASRAAQLAERQAEDELWRVAGITRRPRRRQEEGEAQGPLSPRVPFEGVPLIPGAESPIPSPRPMSSSMSTPRGSSRRLEVFCSPSSRSIAEFVVSHPCHSPHMCSMLVFCCMGALTLSVWCELAGGKVHDTPSGDHHLARLIKNLCAFIFSSYSCGSFCGGRGCRRHKVG